MPSLQCQKDLPDDNILSSLSVTVRGQKNSEGYHVLEYIPLQYPLSLSPFVYIWRSSEW